MSDDQNLEIDITTKATGAGETKELATAVASVGDALREMATIAKNAASATDRIEKSIINTTKSVKNAQSEVKTLTTQYAALARAQQQGNTVPVLKAATNASGGTTAAAATLYGQQIDKNALAAAQATTAARAAGLKVTIAQAHEQAVVEDGLRSQLTILQRQAAVSRLTTANSATMSLSGIQTANITKANNAIRDGVASLGQYQDHLANTRYALYGFSQGLGIAGVALTAANVLIVKQAADFQTAFVNIERTSGLSGDALTDLENKFVSLGQTIPTSFKDLGAIATLAGQLNIPAENIAAFTKVTAEFAATTNVTTEAAATAFGRLDALLPDVQGNYEALGSSILNVGVNSVATESDIISTTTQIAAIGAQAGFTSDQVIGLAASFASLGVAPEAARGTSTRVFSTITTAVNTSNDSLATFAKLAGETAQEFQNDWKSNPAEAFVKVLTGLQTEGSGAETTIRSLGITAVRDISSLLKLSQNVEIVGDNLQYAADGFHQATQLGDSFGKIAGTLASAAQELLNSLQALFATLGASGLQVLTAVVNAVKGLVIGFTELAKNPFVQSIAQALGALTALSGVALLLGSGLGKVVATFLAGRPVVDLFNKTLVITKAVMASTRAEINAGAGAFEALGKSAKIAGIDIKGALVGTGVGLAIVAVFTAVSFAIDEVNQAIEDNKIANESASASAKKYFSDLSGLTTAISKDQDAVKNGAEAYDTVTVKTTTATKAAKDWVPALEAATGAQVKLKAGTETSTKSVDEQTLALSKNTAAWYANTVANDPKLQKLFNNKAVAGAGFNTKGFITALAKGDTDNAIKIYDDFNKKVQADTAKYANLPAGSDKSNAFLDQLNSERDALALIGPIAKSYGGAVTAAASKTNYFGYIADATGQAITGFNDDTDDGTDSVTDFGSAVQAAFGNLTLVSDFASSFQQLQEGIANGGNSFDTFSQAGQTNLTNLQGSITDTINAAGALGVSATEAVSNVFLQLQKEGVDTASLLQSLASQGGLPGVNLGDVSSYLNGTKKLSASSVVLGNAMQTVTNNAVKDAAATKKVGGSSASAAVQVKTLVEYAQDLAGVFDRAFNIRFSGQQALDTISSAWTDIADSTADANKKLIEAQATLDKLTSDKSIQEYFLSVANAYGDTLRAGEISADIEGINNDIASAQQDAADATSDSSKVLTGNSKAAIKNRAAVLGLVSDYQNYIQALASTGASQATLSAKSAQLKTDFINQATQLGYNTTEVQQYAVAFDDMAVAIANVPRNITVTANTNPAKQAVAEFLAANTGGRGASAGISVPVKTSFDQTALAKLARGQALVAQIASFQRDIELADQHGTDPKPYVAAIARISAQLNSGSYKSGGYTGDSGTNKVSGVVHGKEFVINAENTNRLGIPFLNALNNGLTPATQTGSRAGSPTTPQLVQLTASNLQAITDAVRVSLNVDGKAIASTANQGNLVAANRSNN